MTSGHFLWGGDPTNPTQRLIVLEHRAFWPPDVQGADRVTVVAGQEDEPHQALLARVQTAVKRMSGRLVSATLVVAGHQGWLTTLKRLGLARLLAGAVNEARGELHLVYPDRAVPVGELMILLDVLRRDHGHLPMLLKKGPAQSPKSSRARPKARSQTLGGLERGLRYSLARISS